MKNWGATAEEVAATYPCDALVDGDPMWRAIDVEAPAERTFRWLPGSRMPAPTGRFPEPLGVMQC